MWHSCMHLKISGAVFLKTTNPTRHYFRKRKFPSEILPSPPPSLTNPYKLRAYTVSFFKKWNYCKYKSMGLFNIRRIFCALLPPWGGLLLGESIFAGEGWGLFSDYGSAAECLEGPRRAHAVFKEHCGGMNKEHMIDGKNKSNLFECPFRMRNDGFYDILSHSRDI